MYFNQHSGYDPTKTSTYNFYGINRTRRTSKGEFAAMRNMSTEEYPCAAPVRPRKYVAKAPAVINAITAPDCTNVVNIEGLTGISDGGFYYNGVLKSDKYYLSPLHDWQIVRKGNLYLINGYDSTTMKSEMYYYNVDADEFSQNGVMKNLIVYCGSDYIELLEYGHDYVRDYSIISPDGTVIKNKDYFDEYCKNGVCTPPGDNIFEKYGFKVGDEITLEGFPKIGSDCPGQIWYRYSDRIVAADHISTEYNNTVDTDEMTDKDKLSKYANVSAFVKSFYTSNQAMVNGVAASVHRMYLDLYTKDGLAGELDITSNDTYKFYVSGITVRKRRRNFTNITTHHGRVWGSVPSGNMLFASASDDLFSFTSNDIANCYAARLPSDTEGRFNGLCEFENKLIAFKDTSITVVSGSNPNNYYTYSINGIGCIDARSIAVTPSGVIFLSHDGFYIYSGSTPARISLRLNTRYDSAVAGYDGNIYYACAVRSDNKCRELLAYDMRYNVWHILDDIDASGFFVFKGKFYIADNIIIYECNCEDCLEVTDWNFTSVKTHDNTFDNKSVTELWIRCEMSKGSEFKVETSVDGGPFRSHATYSSAGIQIFRCPIRIEMCHYYQYRISGHGHVVFYEIEIHKQFGGRTYSEAPGTVKTTESRSNDELLLY